MNNFTNFIDLLILAQECDYTVQVKRSDTALSADDHYFVSFTRPNSDVPDIIGYDYDGFSHHEVGETNTCYEDLKDHFESIVANKQELQKQKLIQQLGLTKEQLQILGVSY